MEIILKVVRRIFGKLGYDLFYVKRPKKKDFTEANNLIKQIKEDQLNPNLHLQLSKIALRNEEYFLAIAELFTARYLGLEQQLFQENLPKCKDALPDLSKIPHNVYYRIFSLSEVVKSEIKKRNLKEASVLDAGGGKGELASFLSNCNYCLVDPKSNGINGLDLPFKDEEFDFVVSCHVLEHVPLEERNAFLNQLCAKAKHAVILLNPIHVEETLPTRRLELMIETTNALWAKEHLDCSLPKVEFVESYAKENNLHFEHLSNGTITTSIAFAVVDHLSKFWSEDKYRKFNQFFNTEFVNILDSDNYPNAGVFILSKQK
tara:strand:+ start:725 stop:1678 length:954 start_codon:yes stop_codon:yes gene_type:complete